MSSKACKGHVYATNTLPIELQACGQSAVPCSAVRTLFLKDTNF